MYSQDVIEYMHLRGEKIGEISFDWPGHETIIETLHVIVIQDSRVLFGFKINITSSFIQSKKGFSKS